MARLPREASQSGIYHVMLRGVNRQDIFESDKDYLKFLYLMEREAFPKDEEGRPMPPNLIIYAYCLMPNHVHLLVRERSNHMFILLPRNLRLMGPKEKQIISFLECYRLLV